MAYKKPQMVAKASAKKSYIAGCPTHSNGGGSCNIVVSCEIYNKW